MPEASKCACTREEKFFVSPSVSLRATSVVAIVRYCEAGVSETPRALRHGKHRISLAAINTYLSPTFCIKFSKAAAVKLSPATSPVAGKRKSRARDGDRASSRALGSATGDPAGRMHVQL